MQTYDLLMLLVLVAATIFGFWKGMAWQIASLASLVVSYIAALKFSERLAPTFGDTAPWNRFVAMLAIYCLTSFMIWTAFRLVSGVIDKVKLEAFDKQLGAMFGFAKGVLLCIAVTFFAVTLLPPAQGEMIVGSQSGQYIVKFLNQADAVMPPELHQVIDPYLQRVQQRLNPGYQANWPAGGSPSQGGAAPSSGWSLPGWPQGQPLPQVQWPQSQSPSSPEQPAWPSQSQSSAPASSVYGAPREPKPFPDPYSAERQTGGTY
jgi:membrane protein required for colicin V production